MDRFLLHSTFSPTGDQPEAIDALVRGIEAGDRAQTLLGVTGSGKTFTMANVIARLNRPTLVFAHNKTLAAQLCTEFREFFPENAVEYFVSYYDYYQPEAYIPGRDMYIEKDALINDEIDKLRHSATSALFERRDVIIVASVSCIYSLGDPNEYSRLVVSVRPGQRMTREQFIARLVSISYERNDISLTRGKFRAMGDTVEVMPSSESEKAIRVEFFGDEVERVSEIRALTGDVMQRLSYAPFFPATHYAVSDDKREAALAEIEREMVQRAEEFRSENRLIEAQRITERTRFDLEMLREIGSCSGVENYSRVLSGRAPGSTPYTLLDYFPKDYLMFIDESHVTVPQIRGMSGGDTARKKNLVDFGFRLPSAYDNRPLYFEEFERKVNQVVFVSATPSDYEKLNSSQTVEQLIRPTGLLDPEVMIRPVQGQVDDVISEIRETVKKGGRVLVTTLTKQMAEDLTEYLSTHMIRAKYLHHNIETMERTEIIRDLRMGTFDVLVGINLLREGLDIPEVMLVAILDADKEGLLRSETSLIQTIGRAARNTEGRVILYADNMTRSIRAATEETVRRRKIQNDYNTAHGIVPKTIEKSVRDLIDLGHRETGGRKSRSEPARMSASDAKKKIEQLTAEMKRAASHLDFEQAAVLRDLIRETEKMLSPQKGKGTKK